MTEPDLIRLFIEPLEEVEIPYMITGGVASVIYGDPRFTRDIDVVLEEEAARLQGGHFNLIHGETALRADVYLMGDDPLHAWAFARRGDDAPDQRWLGGSARARAVDRRAGPPRSHPGSPTLRTLTAS